tara:strand:- start:28497 stop:28682 length:186 start_codon:yes stop_codon:yes gene_type:complete
MSRESNSSGLLGTLLTVLFIGLKLGGVINWSWWWVLSPIWMSLLIALIGLIVVFIITKIND